MRSEEEVIGRMDILWARVTELKQLIPQIEESISEGKCAPDEIDFVESEMKVLRDQIAAYEWLLVD